jgi:exodeoxyribonuclease VII small subunit
MKPDKQPSFETLITELETIVAELDSSIGLEESLKKYERGMELAKAAEKRLATIENQFEKLQVQFNAPEKTGTPTDNSTVETEVIIAVEEPKNTDEMDLTTLPF